MLGNIKRTAGRFLRDTRGGATTMAAVGASVMALSGGALLIDHNQLVGQRDLLKGAADAASLAATLELNRMPNTLTQDQMQARVLAVAQKYGILNVLGNTTDPDATADDVALTFDIDHNWQVLNVRVEANAETTMVSSWLYSYSGPGAITASARVEALEAPIEVVLAIDTSLSMRLSLTGANVGAQHPTSRMSIVKQAAIEMVEVLDPRVGGEIAMGLVPWDLVVRLADATFRTWDLNGWAEYPDSRHYAAIYQCRPVETCTGTAADNDLPATSPTWEGCLDMHRVSSGHADLAAQSRWFDLPGDLAFAQAIYPALFGRAYNCLTPPRPSDLRAQHCYGVDPGTVTPVWGQVAPQECANKQRMLPLTNDPTTILAQIRTLAPAGGRTNSGLGLLWGQRLLSPTWRSVWGDATYPRDAADDLRKAIVLLTDGEDTQCGGHDPDCSRSDLGHARASVCTAIKAAGTEIFVVAAMHSDDVSGDLGAALRACSSQGERPGTYAFLQNDDGTSLKAAFVSIARQLRSVRRVF